MPMFDVDFNYNVPEWSTVTVGADNSKSAEDNAMEIIKDEYPEITDIEITGVREINETR